jgi:gliding motility-associated-like protein
MMVSLKGFSQVLINEVMPRPSGGDLDACIQSLYNTSNVACGNEWVELYNASPCDTADISCFLLGGKTSSTNAGVFCFPSGTKIPPLSFLTVGGAASGSMISIPALLGQGLICGPSTRWFLENTSGWIALYNPIGTPVDAVYWTFNANSAASLSTNSAFTGGGPACLPTNACGATAPLAAANSAAMSGVIDYAGQVPSAGQTIKRVQDGSITWSTNNVPTIANCNGICATPVNITFTATVVQPSCGNTGSITINVTSSGSSTYTWSANANTGNVNIATSLTAGTYTCTISQNGCVKDTVISLIASSNPAISSISATNVTCNGLTNGTIIISSVINGAQPYQYSINNCVTTQTSNIFNNISSGTYTVCVSDFNGCTATSVVIISQPTSLLINSLSTTNPNCSPGNNGSITVNASGGTLAYQYSINGSALQSSNVFANLGSGTYTITVSDANGCTVTSVQSISAPNAPIFSVAIATNVSCNGGNNGSISSTATGGQGQITYNLQPTNQTNITGSFSNLNANSYTVTATDIAGCSVQTILIVSEPTQLQWTITSATNINCNGGNDGTITATASGGSGQLTYTLQPTNQSNTSGNYSSLGANTYTITASDINGCTITTTLSITAPTAVQWATASSTNVTCNNASNGSITTTASGGTGQITYTLQPTNQSNTSGGFMGLAPNSYTITATDINGCTSTTIITITEPNPLTITSIVAVQPTCIPGNDGSLNITASGGTQTYLYSINGGGLQAGSNFGSLISGVYTMQVVDGNGCTATSSVSLIEPNSPIINLVEIISQNCKKNNDIKVTLINGLAPFNFQLLPSGITSSTGLFSNLPIGSYTIIVTDANSCSISTLVSILPSNPVIANLKFNANGSCANANIGEIVVQATGGEPPYSYSIMPGGQISTTGTFSNMGRGVYTITTTDVNECQTTNVITIKGTPCCDELFIPNAFTPNDDTKNDEFTFLNALDTDIELLSFIVMNRYGNSVFQAQHFYDRWDGKYKGSVCDVGTYYYFLKFKCLTSGEVIIRKGDITLIR